MMRLKLNLSANSAEPAMSYGEVPKVLSLLCNVTPPPMVVSEGDEGEGNEGVHANEVDKGANYISGNTVSFQRYWTTEPQTTSFLCQRLLHLTIGKENL